MCSNSLLTISSSIPEERERGREGEGGRREGEEGGRGGREREGGREGGRGREKRRSEGGKRERGGRESLGKKVNRVNMQFSTTQKEDKGK